MNNEGRRISDKKSVVEARNSDHPPVAENHNKCRSEFDSLNTSAPSDETSGKLPAVPVSDKIFESNSETHLPLKLIVDKTIVYESRCVLNEVGKCRSIDKGIAYKMNNEGRRISGKKSDVEARNSAHPPVAENRNKCRSEFDSSDTSTLGDETYGNRRAVPVAEKFFTSNSEIYSRCSLIIEKVPVCGPGDVINHDNKCRPIDE